MFSDRVKDTRRIDCISLEPIPRRYDIVIGSSHHDARTLAEYVLTDGATHPLSRDLFTPRDYLDIGTKVSGGLRDRVLHKGFEIARDRIVQTLGVIRAVNFLSLLCTHEFNEMLYLIFLLIDCLDTKADIGDYSQKVRDTRFAHVLFASRPDIDPKRIRAVLDSQDLRTACDFLDAIEDFLLKDFEAYFLTRADIFNLITAMCEYNVETDFM